MDDINIELKKIEKSVYNHIYHKKHIEKIHRQKKIYQNTFEGRKSVKYSDWKRMGITFEGVDKDEFYLYFLNKTHCDSCLRRLNDKNNILTRKSLDHIRDTDLPMNVRGIICNECNIHDNWSWRMLPSSIYQNYLEEYIMNNQ